MRVLFRVAAGPRIGFGHLVRARSLSRALGVAASVSIRGTEDTCHAAARHGFELCASQVTALDGTPRPELLVVDDPAADQAREWVDAARAHGIPVVSVIDRGLACLPADLVIDGSIDAHAGPGILAGTRYAVLDPAVAAAREMQPVERSGVLVALGGGSHVHTWGAMLGSAILQRLPDTHVRIVGGFVRRVPAARGPIRWVSAPDGLVDELRRAAVAVVAGGVTLYEAAALGTATVGLAVVAAQQPAIAAFARRGAVMNAGLADHPAAVARAADAVLTLMTHRQRASRAAAIAARLVDGRGAFRAADAIRTLARRPKDHTHAA